MDQLLEVAEMEIALQGLSGLYLFNNKIYVFTNIAFQELRSLNYGNLWMTLKSCQPSTNLSVVVLSIYKQLFKHYALNIICFCRIHLEICITKA